METGNGGEGQQEAARDLTLSFLHQENFLPIPLSLLFASGSGFLHHS